MNDGPSFFRRGVLGSALGLYFVCSGKAFGSALTRYYTPEYFGADPSGVTPSSGAITAMLLRASLDGTPCVCDRPNAIYRLDRPVRIKTRGKALSFTGLGASSTKILIDGWFTGLSIECGEGDEVGVQLRDFEITRANYESFGGKIGKRSIEVLRSSGVTISGIAESGSVGFGIFLDRCRDYEISQCVVARHLTGKTHRSGTDGIHIYRSPGPGRVFNNVIHNVGDDAISFGSFSSSEPTSNFECFDNVISDVAGSIKVYGNTSGFKIFRNQVTRPKTGGVVIYDDRNRSESFNITDGAIYENIVKEQIGAGICGGISIWSPAGDGEGVQKNIVIRDNVIVGGNFGITVASQAPFKAPMNIIIKNNDIRNMRQRGIVVDRFAGDFSVEGNDIYSTGFEGALLGVTQASKTAGNLVFVGNKLTRTAFADESRSPIRANQSSWHIDGNTIG